VLVGTTHLESLRRSAKIRPIQLKEIFALLNDSDNSVLMGDFNFCSSWDENSNIDSSYLDFCQVLRFDDPGYTAEEDINIMRRHINKEDDNVRIDRIMSRSENQNWKPTRIDRIGMEPISPKYPDIFPSDHFGLIGKLEYKR
jgi:tyrosyl-DNA phosphodiesterase 2